MKTEKEIRKKVDELLSEGTKKSEDVQWKYWVCHALNWVLEG